MAKRTRIRIEKKAVDADGDIPTDVSGQPDRRWLAVDTVWAKREDVTAGSGEDLEDDADRAVQSAEFTFYKTEDEITTDMRLLELTANDQLYDIREVREKLQAPQEYTIHATKQVLD